MSFGRDAVIGLICLLAAVGLFLLAQGLPRPALVPIGPGFYPRILFAVTAVLSVLLLVSGLRRKPGPAGPPTSHRLVLATFAIFILYVGLLPYVGYRVGTLVFVALLQVAIEPPRTPRRWGLVAIVAVATTVVTFYVFEVYLSVLLPRGVLTGF